MKTYPSSSAPTSVFNSKANLRLQLEGYKGDFEFLLKMQKYCRTHGLTYKQWMGVDKCFNAPKNHIAPTINNQGVSGSPTAQPSIPCDIPMILKRRAATGIKRDYNLPFYPFTVTAKQIHAKTYKAILATVVFTTGSVSVCRCCGKRLEDMRSQATGIGPICAKRYKIPYPKDCSAPEIAKFKADLEALAKSIGVLKVWIPLQQIKDGRAPLSLILSKVPVHNPITNKQVTSSPVQPTYVNGRASGIENIRWNPYDSQDIIKYHKVSKTFSAEASSLKFAPGLQSPKIFIENINSKGIKEFDFNVCSTDSEGDISHWEYVCGGLKLIIFND